MKYISDPETLFATSADELPRPLFMPVLNWLPVALFLVAASSTTVDSVVVRKLFELIAAEQVALFATIFLTCVLFFTVGTLQLTGRTHDDHPSQWMRALVVSPAGYAFRATAPIAALMCAGLVYLVASGAFAPAVRFGLAAVTTFQLRLLIWFAARQGYVHAAERIKTPWGRLYMGLTMAGSSVWLLAILQAEVAKF